MYPFWHQVVLDQSLHLSREGIKISTVFISQSCRMNGYESATTCIMAVLDPGVTLLRLLYQQVDSLPLAPPATSQANSLSSLNSTVMSKVFCLVLLSSLFLHVVDKVVVLTNPSHLSLLWQLCGLCGTGPTPTPSASPDDLKPTRKMQDVLWQWLVWTTQDWSSQPPHLIWPRDCFKMVQ